MAFSYTIPLGVWGDGSVDKVLVLQVLRPKYDLQNPRENNNNKNKNKHGEVHLSSSMGEVATAAPWSVWPASLGSLENSRPLIDTA